MDDRRVSPPDFITVVSGLPRSGTSLLMQMLAAGGLEPLADEHRGPDASNPRGYLEYEPVKASARDTSWVPRARGRAVKVIHALLEHLPPDERYKVILLQRPLEEVLASQARMLEREGKRGAALPPGRLAAIFGAQLDKARALLERGAHFEWIELRYHDALADPTGFAERVAAFLELPLDTAAMAAQVDPTLYRERAGG
ncbi:MAG: sulfotransferase family protein [Planctomycetota bacterium]|nr:MAG: sulfotransferase family protein [Planctomycetota bacterium]